MSLLNEKFGNVVLGKDHNSDCEKIAEQFACGFGNWVMKNKNNMKLYVFIEIDQEFIRLPMKDILEIYKKEKGYV